MISDKDQVWKPLREQEAELKRRMSMAAGTSRQRLRTTDHRRRKRNMIIVDNA